VFSDFNSLLDLCNVSVFFLKYLRNAKPRVQELDEQQKVDIVEGGWMEYLTKELGMKDTDNVLWDLT
jgi:hypothetical protein